MLMSVYVRLRRLAPVTGGTVFRARYRSAWFTVPRTTTRTRTNMYQARRVASGEGYSSLSAPARLRRWGGQSLSALRRSDLRGSPAPCGVFFSTFYLCPLYTFLTFCSAENILTACCSVPPRPVHH